MNRCPITYEDCGENKYSKKGLWLLSKKLTDLNDFPYTPKEQLQLAAELSEKLSIQGVQPKLSVSLNVSRQLFEVVEIGGTYIFKPPHQLYEELPQNEDLTMKLASLVGIKVPLHGMIYNIDGSLTYFIKRFDRLAKKQKIAVEDFSQLLGLSRDTKYESSMEKMVPIVDKHCTFPLLEKAKLFQLIIFNFLTGNEDMHIKNFSLIRRKESVEFSPAYDLLNTSLVLKTKEEIALPINGKKSNLNRKDLIDYFAKERLGLSEATIQSELNKFKKSLTQWSELIDRSFLSEDKRKRYHEMIASRWSRLKN